MRSPVGFMGVVFTVLAACSGTTSPGTGDAATTTDVVDATDVVDVVDATDVIDGSDVVDATDVVDVATTDSGVRCGSTETACMTGGVAVCVDTRSDSRHCGGCGRGCCAGEFCAAGACTTSCGAGVTPCTPPGGVCPVCVVLRNDSAHCGACNRACASGQACVDGACVTPACAAVTEPPAPMGVCDGRGRIACEMWAQGIAGGRPNVTAQCLTSPSGCARADRCDDLRDASTCRCGADLACAPNEVCALVGPTARCQCARL